MEKAVYTRVFRAYLREIALGLGDRTHQNPALRFAGCAEAGAYDRLPDEFYIKRLREAEALSPFWRGEAEQTASELLCAVLEQARPDRASRHRLADVLAECVLSQENELLPDGRPEDAEESGQARGVPEGNPRRLPDQKLYSGRPQKTKTQRLRSPREIYDQLARDIYGQKGAVKAAAMLLYNHWQGRKRNILFIGQTGCGKTEIWRVCGQLHPGIRVIDSTALTGEGWKGAFKIRNIFDGMTKEEAERAIIVLDEFDKLCEPQITSGGSNASFIVQNELLKLIEGTTLQLGNISVDTSNISFVFCGSFERLTKVKTDREAEQSIGFGARLERRDNHRVYETALQPADLVRYAGVRQEIAGRIHQIVQLSPMTAEDFRAILADERISPLRKLERQYGVKLRLDNETAQRLVEEAAETRMGVRYLHSRIQQMLDDQVFRDCGRMEYELGA